MREYTSEEVKQMLDTVLAMKDELEDDAPSKTILNMLNKNLAQDIKK